MKILKMTAIALVALALVALFAAPIGPMPGFFIGGTPSPAPAQWGDTSNQHEIQLRVPGALPRVVNIWVVQHEGDLYVIGAKDSGWVSMIGSGKPVTMRMGDSTYALNASLVSEGWQPVVQAYLAKYAPDYPEIVAGFPPIEEAEGQIAVFRLARS
ncbi:MAG: hypothetical protein R3E86_21140 [Pseudomonadales bacterium]